MLTELGNALIAALIPWLPVALHALVAISRPARVYVVRGGTPAVERVCQWEEEAQAAGKATSVKEFVFLEKGSGRACNG